MSRTIYVDGLGHWNAIAEKDQIIWAWEQRVKRYTDKAWITKFWLNLLERHEKHLFEIQAYELIMYLKSKVTDEQRQNRKKWREKAQELAKAETQKQLDYHTNWKLKTELITVKYLN